MSSILTNSSAMVALQTLKSINNDLSTTQNQISTGKTVNNSKDNSAIFAIASTMEADISGIDTVQNNLSLGKSVTATARNAADQVTDLLTQIKDKVVLAQDDSADSGKIQAEISSLRDTITSIVDSAQFNGVNLLKDDGAGDYEVLSSLNRDGNGKVTAATIDVAKQDLQVDNATFGAGGVLTAGAITNPSGAIGDDNATGATAAIAASFAAGALTAGDSFRITLAGTANGEDSLKLDGNYEYVAREGDTQNDVVTALADLINQKAKEEGVDFEAVAGLSADTATNATTLSFRNGIAAESGGTANDVTVTSAHQSGGTAGGGLADLADIDVSVDAADALTKIEGLIQTSISASAAFGAQETKIENQSSFLGKLTDSLKEGVGSLVDADMEEVSARLTALQTQQQLGVQSLSIANSAPQTLLSLFR